MGAKPSTPEQKRPVKERFSVLTAKTIRSLATGEYDGSRCYLLVCPDDPASSFVLQLDKFLEDKLTFEILNQKMKKAYPQDKRMIMGTYFGKVNQYKPVCDYIDCQPFYYEPDESFVVSIFFKEDEIKLDVDPSYSLITIRQKLKDLNYKIPSESHRFHRSDQGNRFDETKTLKENNIKQGCKLLIKECSRREILISYDLRELKMNVDELTTIQEIVSLSIPQFQLNNALRFNVFLRDKEEKTLMNPELTVGEIEARETTMFTIEENTEQCSFPDVGKPHNSIKMKWSPSAPKWRIAKPGLCFEGECPNSKCDSKKIKNSFVIINKGFGTIDMIEDAWDSFCPLCGSKVKPVTFGFNRCLYHRTGIEITSRGPEIYKEERWKEVGDEYERFDPQKKCEWSKLKIHTKRKEAAIDGVTKEKCPICFKVVEKGEPLECSHFVDDACREMIKKIVNVKCILCTY